MSQKVVTPARFIKLVSKTFIVLFTMTSIAGTQKDFWYPEERTYTSADRNLRPYQAKSIHKTGSFALTFDDGPDLVRTPKVLDILKAHDVKAVFFVLSKNLSDATYPLIKRMLDEGHLVASHGTDHAHGRDLTKAQFKASVSSSLLELAKYYKRAGYDFDKIFYRYPYGDYGSRSDYHHMNALKEVSQELFGDNCIQFAFWDIDTSDWVDAMTPQDVAQNIIANYEGGTAYDFKLVNGKYVKVPYQIKVPFGGGVVLQHDVREPTIQGLEIFLQYAEKKGLKLPRLDDVEEFKVTKTCKL